jgi:hypothetical protein
MTDFREHWWQLWRKRSPKQLWKEEIKWEDSE